MSFDPMSTRFRHFDVNYSLPHPNQLNARCSTEIWTRIAGFKVQSAQPLHHRGTRFDEDGIATHAGRAQRVSSPSP